MFIDREKEIARLQQALQREKARLIVVYGRRRCGKTTLLRHVLPQNAIYFAADLREPPLQIAALAKQIDKLILPRFSGHLDRPQVNRRGGGVHETESKEV